MTSFHFLHGLDSPSRWVPGWLQEGGGGGAGEFTLFPSPMKKTMVRSYLPRKGQSRTSGPGFCLWQPEPGELRPPLPASATSKGLEGLPKDHRFGL